MSASRRVSQWLKQAVREHWLPLLILVAPVNWVVWQSDASNAILMLPLPLIALIVGFTFRPRHVWLLWLGSVVVEWITVGLWGKYSDPGAGETAFSIMIEAFGWMFFGVLIPLWLGRLLREALADLGWHMRRRPGA